MPQLPTTIRNFTNGLMGYDPELPFVFQLGHDAKEGDVLQVISGPDFSAKVGAVLVEVGDPEMIDSEPEERLDDEDQDDEDPADSPEPVDVAKDDHYTTPTYGY